MEVAAGDLGGLLRAAVAAHRRMLASATRMTDDDCRGPSLLCEVTDASSTAPHLKRSRTLDEDGRGLLLVCKLTQSWGTRQTTSGKTIWCQQVLSDPLLESA